MNKHYGKPAKCSFGCHVATERSFRVNNLWLPIVPSNLTLLGKPDTTRETWFKPLHLKAPSPSGEENGSPEE